MSKTPKFNPPTKVSFRAAFSLGMISFVFAGAELPLLAWIVSTAGLLWLLAAVKLRNL